MDVSIPRKRERGSPDGPGSGPGDLFSGDDESTDVKLAILLSLHPDRAREDLLELLLASDGSVDSALEVLSQQAPSLRTQCLSGRQTSLPFANMSHKKTRSLTRKGRILHLFTPNEIENHTPCSIIHNFLPADLANGLLKEILPEAVTFSTVTFKLFDNVVQSPHTSCFYVNDLEERNRQKCEYLYNGSNLDDVREILPVMRQVSILVEDAVNSEIARRIQTRYPGGKKLKYQSPGRWWPNAAFVNCYDGGQQSVGYHSDQLSYLGPRAVIGSLSLGVEREFRVRKIVPKEEGDRGEAADAQGQIAIHLPHNSLLVMHADMQEEWKHSIAPAATIVPHPISGNKRINITYRWYRASFNPKYTPKCKCGVPTVLRTVQRRKETRGRYIWQCQVGGQPSGGKGCGYFEWAEFTDDGEPIWKHETVESRS